MRAGVSLRSAQEANSRAAALRESGFGGAVADARGGDGDGLSSDESRCKGKNDESGEAEHMELEAWGGCKKRVVD